MPMWDNFADQIAKLPTAPAIAPTSDRLIYQAADQTFGETALLKNVPFMLDFMLNGSGAGVTPTASTTPKETFTTPFAIEALAVYVSHSTSQGSGTAPSFDMYNETDSTSLIDATATASAVLTIANGTTAIEDAAPDAPAVASAKTIGFHCVTAPATLTGSTWGHLLFYGV